MEDTFDTCSQENQKPEDQTQDEYEQIKINTY